VHTVIVLSWLIQTKCGRAANANIIGGTNSIIVKDRRSALK